VACTWRIRHKLILGMGLVVAIMALLLAGTLNGLSSYKTTMRVLNSKLAELEKADGLREAIKKVGTPSETKSLQAGELFDRIKPARTALQEYRDQLDDSLRSGRDPDGGHQEQKQIEAIEKGFEALEHAIHGEVAAMVVVTPGDGRGLDLLAEAAPVRKQVGDLGRMADDLLSLLYGELRERIDASRGEYRFTVALLLTTASVALLLVAGLLRFFYKSVVRPIRDLEQGVGRVARGDFEHRIDIRSGDEIEDLAAAFNNMTGRLSEMYRSLAQQVNERSRQLVRSERLAGVGFLAAGVAHEINNPLASIMFYSEALERRLADLLRARGIDPQERDVITKYLKVVQEEAERCKGITSKLLSFSRGGDRTRERADLTEVVQGVLDMVQHLPSCKDKQLVFEPHDHAHAWVNAQEIKQVFLNLVVNALENMDDGGRLTIRTACANGQVELTFADTGCGMSADVLENMFEPFFTRSRTGKGTGLGLSISHRIITQHGGEISADSPGPGQGSTFTVRLPIEPPADSEANTEEVRDPEQEFLKLSTLRQERKVA
jgi:signal transduction histidine kinase